MASALPDVTGQSISPLEPTGDDTSESNETQNSHEKRKSESVMWEEEDVTLEYIGDEDRLPCICQFAEIRQDQEDERQTPRLSQGLKLYSHQPVLMHSRMTKLKARARSIHKDPKGAYYEIGQTLIIPYDYAGWFEVVPSDFKRVTCYRTINDVANEMPTKFFTRSNLKGIRLEGTGEQQKILERKIAAGSVLQTNGTYTAKWRTRAETGLFKKKTKEWDMEEVTYLKCIDHDNKEILVPVGHKGKFNAIYECGKLTPNAVYSMKDILEDLSLPLMVRLLYGKAPVVPCIFTGMLIIRETAIDDALIGSTIINQRNVLFEIPLRAPVKVKYLSNDEHFAESDTYKDAKKLCRKYSPLFSTMIKLSPELDTDQKTILHVPTDPSLMRQCDESLRALDLITDISLTSEPKDHLMDSEETGSQGSYDYQNLLPKGARLVVEADFKSRETQTHV